MSRPHAFLLGFATIAALTSGCSGSSEASCSSGLEVTAQPAHLGGPLPVEGIGFTSGCSDTGGPPAPPLTGIRLTLEQNGRLWPLGTVDAAGGRASFHLDVIIPIDAGAGPATLRAGASSAPLVLAE